MKRLVLLGLLVLVTAASSSATNAPNPASEPVQMEARPVEIDEAPIASPQDGISSKMMEEIRALIAAEKDFADRMSERAISGPVEDRLEIQRQVNDSAAEMYLDILRIQARYARLEGRDELAQQIESTIEIRIAVQNDPSIRMAPVETEKIRRERRGDTPQASSAKPVTRSTDESFGQQGGGR